MRYRPMSAAVMSGVGLVGRGSNRHIRSDAAKWDVPFLALARVRIRGKVRSASCPPTQGATRVFRAGFLGSVSLLLAVAAHLLGGGTLPPVRVMLAVSAMTAVVSGAMTARRCRMGLLAAVTGVSQLFLHLMLSLGPVGGHGLSTA